MKIEKSWKNNFQDQEHMHDHELKYKYNACSRSVHLRLHNSRLTITKKKIYHLSEIEKNQGLWFVSSLFRSIITASHSYVTEVYTCTCTCTCTVLCTLYLRFWPMFNKVHSRYKKAPRTRFSRMISHFQEWKIVFLDEQDLDFSIF